MKVRDLEKFNLPDSPGVYTFKKGDNILYIGKATSLKDRVRSYFSTDLINSRGVRIVDMVTLSDSVEYEETDSVLEALILEARDIKKHKPKYNIKEKDNKSFSYVLITDEEWPRVYVSRERSIKFENTKTKKVFGPFPSRNQIQEALRIIRKIFPYRTEKITHERFYSQLGLMPNTAGDNSHKEYLNTIRHISLFLQGKKKKVIKEIEKKMKELAKELKFEEAEKLRRKIFSLNHLRDVSLIKYDNELTGLRIEGYDVAHISGTNTVGVMTVVIDGEVEKDQYRKFKVRTSTRGDDLKALKEILTRRVSHFEWGIPDLIVIDGGSTQRAITESVLKDTPFKNVPIVNLVKNNKHKVDRLVGDKDIIKENKRNIILVNSEAHRFAIGYHRKLRDKIK
jgi:excinuclease ABC subunit C